MYIRRVCNHSDNKHFMDNLVFNPSKKVVVMNIRF